MKEDDIEVYLRAKNPYSYGNIVYLVVVGIFALAAASTFIPTFQEYSKYFVLVGLIVGSSTYGLGAKSYITRKQLLNLLERQVNSDPSALRYISQKYADRHTNA